MKRLLLLTVAAILVTLAASPSARAYDVDTGHVPLLSLSLDLYAQCFPSGQAYQSADARNRLVQGDRGMDKGKWDMYRHLKLSHAEKKRLKGVAVFHLAHRVRNWHFYNPERAEFSRIDDTEQSFIRLWQELRDGFRDNNGPSKLLFLGGLLHLIEDVTVPAHSIPVYHGPAAIPSIDHEYLKSIVQYMRKARRVRNGQIKDPIDWIKPDTKQLETMLVPAKDFCAVIGNGEESPEEVRDDLAAVMQIVLQMPISGCDGLSWADLWIMPEEGRYFGRYNIGSGGPMFGEAGIVRSSNGAACSMQKDDSRYADFVLQLHSLAVMADLRLLRWADREITGQQTTVQLSR